MFKKILNIFKRKDKAVETKETKKEHDLEFYVEHLKDFKTKLIELEKENDYSATKMAQLLKAQFYIPFDILMQMSDGDICFYALNSDNFKTEIEVLLDTKQKQEERKEIFERITSENNSYKYTLETSINLLTFYGEEIDSKGINNLVYSIIDKAHGDMGVYTTLMNMLKNLNNIEAIEIVYSAISFKFGEEVAKKMLDKLNIDADFSKTNKII